MDDNKQPTPDTLTEETTSIESFGKGAVITPEEISKDQYVLAMSAPAVIDWSIPFRVPAALVQRDQDGSSSCTGQAAAYYTQALNQIEHGVSELYSARHIYSQVALGYGQGAYIFKAMSIPLTQGAASLNSVPEGDSSEAIMIDKSDNSKAVLEAKTDKYALISREGQSIDFMANIIKDYHGFVTGFNGWNGMFSPDGTVIDWSKSDWGHAVYCIGYEMHNGQKCLVFINSWGSQWGSGGIGYFPEAFVTSGRFFDAHVFALIEDIDPNSMQNTLVKLDDVNDKNIWIAKDGKRWLVQNVGAFQVLGGNIDNVQKLTQVQFDALPDSGRTLAEIVQE